MAEIRDFKGVWIPKEVWLDTRLNALDKVILTEIDSLDNGERGCYASNRHLAEFCQCSENKVSTTISKLKKLGYIYVQSFDGRTRELRSRLFKNENQPFEFQKAESQNSKESNIDSNTDNNKEKKERKKKTYDEAIAGYTNNTELSEALKAFVQMRTMMKKPLTDRALSLLLNKLDSLGHSDSEKIAMLNNAVMNNWLSVYPLKHENAYSKPEQKYDQNGYESEADIMAMYYGKK